MKDLIELRQQVQVLQDTVSELRSEIEMMRNPERYVSISDFGNEIGRSYDYVKKYYSYAVTMRNGRKFIDRKKLY